MRKDPYVGWIELFEGLIVGLLGKEGRLSGTCGVVGRRQLPMQRTVLEGGGMPSFSVVIGNIHIKNPARPDSHAGG